MTYREARMFKRVAAPGPARSSAASRKPLSGSGEERTARGVEVVAREQRTVGQVHVLGGGVGRAPRVLQWARANSCPWDENTCSCAAGHGQLEVLQWTRANSCPWDAETCGQAAQG